MRRVLAVTRHLPLASLALLAAAGAGCDGRVGNITPDDDGGVTAPTPPTSAFGTGEAGGAFALLPFRIRLRRVADVVGVSVDDALLEPFRRSRVELGDYDFAAGVAPDRAWTAARMSTWVRALRPVCASEAMRDRYPSLPGADLPALVQAAYGRPIEPDDRGDIDAALAGLPLDEAGRYQATCLAVLSSAEFLVQ